MKPQSLPRRLTNFLKRTLPIDLGQYELRYLTKGKLIAYGLVELAGGKALDLGCRDGYWSEKLKEQGYDVVAVDIEPHYANALRVDANERLPFNDDEFDLVWCAEVIEHLTDPEFTIRECKRVLKPGGVLLLTTPNRGFWLYRVIGWTGLLPAVVSEHHLHFLSFDDLDHAAPGGAFYGFFPYWLLKWRVCRGASWLSPTIVWRLGVAKPASGGEHHGHSDASGAPRNHPDGEHVRAAASAGASVRASGDIAR